MSKKKQVEKSPEVTPVVTMTTTATRNIFNAPVSLQDHGADHKVLSGDVIPLLPLMKEWGIAPIQITVLGEVSEAYLIPNSRAIEVVEAIEVINNRLS